MNMKDGQSIARVTLRIPGPTIVGIGLGFLLTVLFGIWTSGTREQVAQSAPVVEREIRKSGCLALVMFVPSEPELRAALDVCLARFPLLNDRVAVGRLQRHTVLLLGDCASKHGDPSVVLGGDGNECADVAEEIRQMSADQRKVLIETSDKLRALERNWQRLQRLSWRLDAALTAAGFLLLLIGGLMTFQDRHRAK